MTNKYIQAEHNLQSLVNLATTTLTMTVIVAPQARQLA